VSASYHSGNSLRVVGLIFLPHYACRRNSRQRFPFTLAGADS